MQEARGRRVDRRVAVARIEAQREQRRLDLRSATQVRAVGQSRRAAPCHVSIRVRLRFGCSCSESTGRKRSGTALGRTDGRSAHCCCAKAGAGAAGQRWRFGMSRSTQACKVLTSTPYGPSAPTASQEKEHLVEVDNIRVACCEQPVAIQRPYLRRTAHRQLILYGGRMCHL